MICVNDFTGNSDSEIFENAMRALTTDRILVIPPREQPDEPERHIWMLDRAILLEAGTTVILQNCELKLSDACRDNFFRSANCGIGIEDPQPISGIHIRGEGNCVLRGADHPRAVGDGSKVLSCPCPKTKEDLLRLADWIPAERKESGNLDFWDEHAHSYGTDALKENESHYGDWRGIGILLANCDHFSIENLKIIDSHGWAISCEACSYGWIEHIEFDACMAKEIDGMLMNMENQDGVDLRNGCHDILINDITGGTGDDIIALTAIADNGPYYPGGSMQHSQVMHNDWTRRDRDIHDIIIRNIRGYSKGHICFHVRLLPAEAKIWNVVIDGVVDTSPEGFYAGGVIFLGQFDSEYGTNLPDSMQHITISNVICDSADAILVQGYLADSVITNVINRNPHCPAINVVRKGGLKNVLTSSIYSASGEIIRDDA